MTSFQYGFLVNQKLLALNKRNYAFLNGSSGLISEILMNFLVATEILYSFMQKLVR